MPESTIESPNGRPYLAPGSWSFKVAGLVFVMCGAIAFKQPDLFENTDLDQQIANLAMIGLAWLSPGLRTFSIRK